MVEMLKSYQSNVKRFHKWMQGEKGKHNIKSTAKKINVNIIDGKIEALNAGFAGK